MAIAFADTDPSKPGGVTFHVDSSLSSTLGGYSDANLRSDVATLHGRGQHVVLSVGGQNGTVSVGDSTAAANFANSVHGIMTSFGFDGVDIDLENGVNPSAMSQALHSLRSMTGSSLIVTLAPQTIDMQSTGGAYFQLALNIKDILTVVHTQYYNSGLLGQFTTLGDAWSLTFTQPGTFQYVCLIHDDQGMKGTITVQAPGGAPTPPAPPSDERP